MRVLQINATYGYGSTGTIAKLISDVVEENGDEAYAAYQYGSGDIKNGYRIGNPADWKWHAIMTRVSGKQGYNSKTATRKLLKWMDEVKPDVVHLHNLHANYINVDILCDYLAKNNIPTVLSLHDCWPFTGKCWHFSYEGCDKWKKECGDCPTLKKEVPSWFFDRTSEVLKDKCGHLNKIPSLTIVGCSDWISNLARESRLGENRIVTVHNGIDLNVFKPRESDFRAKHAINDNEKMVLGVSASWSDKKGIDTFIELADMLSEDYRIVLVGDTDKVLPDRIIHIPQTENREELAEIYTAADVFVNPTLEEVLGLVNLEALACGTPVATFKTGGCVECIDEDSGLVVQNNTAESLKNAIEMVCGSKISKEDCRKRAEKFDARDKNRQYYSLYKEITA